MMAANSILLLFNYSDEPKHDIIEKNFYKRN